MALLKISDANIAKTIYPPYSFYPSMIDVGENIYVLGYPLTKSMGDEIKLTNGIVSSRSGYEGDVSLYQISAPIQPGNSGGPMFDMKGRLVGIICAKHEGAENASYAIKSSYLKNLIESVSSASIFPTSTKPMDKELKDQVKKIKNYVYIIKCSNWIIQIITNKKLVMITKQKGEYGGVLTVFLYWSNCKIICLFLMIYFIINLKG